MGRYPAGAGDPAPATVAVDLALGRVFAGRSGGRPTIAGRSLRRSLGPLLVSVDAFTKCVPDSAPEVNGGAQPSYCRGAHCPERMVKSKFGPAIACSGVSRVMAALAQQGEQALQQAVQGGPRVTRWEYARLESTDRGISVICTHREPWIGMSPEAFLDTLRRLGDERDVHERPVNRARRGG